MSDFAGIAINVCGDLEPNSALLYALPPTWMRFDSIDLMARFVVILINNIGLPAE